MTIMAAPRRVVMRVNLRRAGMIAHNAPQRRSECIPPRSCAACSLSFMVFCEARNVRCCSAKCRTSFTAARGMHGSSSVAGCSGCRPWVQPSACCGLTDDYDVSVSLTASTWNFTSHMSSEAGLHLHGTRLATETKGVGNHVDGSGDASAGDYCHACHRQGRSVCAVERAVGLCLALPVSAPVSQVDLILYVLPLSLTLFTTCRTTR
jgi:hypothetical protein